MAWLYGSGKGTGKRGFNGRYPAHRGIDSPHSGLRKELSASPPGLDGDCKVIKNGVKT
jgi:hypothetical protein